MTAPPTPATDRQLADLSALLEISRQLSATTELAALLATVERSCLQVLDCERTTIFLFDAKADELVSRVATGIGPSTDAGEIRFAAGRGIAGEVLRTRAVLNIPDAYSDARFNAEVDRQTGFRTRNLLTCPLLGHDGSAVGVLQALNKRGGSFGPWEEHLILTFAAQVGVAVQRQQLLAVFAEKQRIQADLDLARSIQQGLLPARAPIVSGFDLAGWNRPADATGGDFFDFHHLASGRIAVTLADVSGHGIGPALLAAECRALLRASLALSPDLARVVRLVNDLLAADMGGGRFITAFVGLLDPAARRCELLSAGQGPMLLYRASTGSVADVPTSGVPFGILPRMDYDPAEVIDFAPGDALVLCTDGFFEWPDPSGDRFGTDRLQAVIRTNHHLRSVDLIEELVRAVEAFASGVAQQDDLTAVILKKC